MKVIDLLNKIAKGEKVPFRIRVSNDYYHFDDEEDMYYRDDEDKEEFYTDSMITGFVDLNDEIEIIEKIRNLDNLKEFIVTNMGYYTRYLNDASSTERYVNDMNYIIEIINDLKENSK